MDAKLEAEVRRIFDEMAQKITDECRDRWTIGGKPMSDRAARQTGIDIAAAYRAILHEGPKWKRLWRWWKNI